MKLENIKVGMQVANKISDEIYVVKSVAGSCIVTEDEYTIHLSYLRKLKLKDIKVGQKFTWGSDYDLLIKGEEDSTCCLAGITYPNKKIKEWIKESYNLRTVE